MAQESAQPQQLPIKKIVPEAKLPVRAHADDAGLDLHCLEDVHLPPQGGRMIRTGIAIAIPRGYVGLVADRSSLAKKGVKSAGGVIDSGYRGELHVVLWNLSRDEIHLSHGDRIAQLLILPIVTPAVFETQELDETARGSKGFGSSGR